MLHFGSLLLCFQTWNSSKKNSGKNAELFCSNVSKREERFFNFKLENYVNVFFKNKLRWFVPVGHFKHGLITAAKQGAYPTGLHLKG
jgi:hypothetical protein